VLLSLKAQSKQVSVADLPALAGAFKGEIKTSIGLDRMRQLIGLGGQFGGPGINRLVLVPPYTSETTIGGQDVVLPSWQAILPLVHKSFP
jgi:hypothetical protein